MSTTQVAVRMDAELLERLDWLVVRGSFENRAEAVRAAIEAFARHEREREIDAAIVESYTKFPQTDEEQATPDFTSWNRLDDEDWSDWQ